MPGITADTNFQAGRAVVGFTGQVARTNTSSFTLLTLPANFIPLFFQISSPAVSNAGTTATVSVGISGGSATAYLNAQDVKGATGAGQQFFVGTAATPDGATVGTTAQVVTAIYAETGTASSSGGPWTVTIFGFAV